MGQKCSNKQTSKKLPVQSNYFHINENDIQLILQDKLTIWKTYLIELEKTQILQEFGARTKSALFPEGGGRENRKQFVTRPSVKNGPSVPFIY